MRKNHNLPSYVAFVDLVKAYNMANYSLILDILEQYRAPPRFVSAIERTYQDLTVVLKIEQEIVELPLQASDKATTWPLCCSSSSCLPLQKPLRLNGKMRGLEFVLYAWLSARNWHRMEVNSKGTCQKNSSQGGLPQLKSYNASMLMMAPSYLRHDPT
jgi:hypothetical protein